MNVRTAALAALCLLLMQGASADMGRVYLDSESVKVSEAAQKAIILHNDQEEVLILGTEIGAAKATKIVRFIPFPSEPKVSLAPKGVFDRLATIVAKYKLDYVVAFHSKGGSGKPQLSGVDVTFKARLGAHDITVLRVKDVTAFRAWVNTYFHNAGKTRAYPKEEAVVADYVARGLTWFVLDSVDLKRGNEAISPVIYRFASKDLYYPLKTSNTFGGKGTIELYLATPATLCAPGSNIFLEEGDKAVNSEGRVTGPCLNLNVKASTSVRLVPEEGDLKALYPEAEMLFGQRPAYLQAIRYSGPYQFDSDILVRMPQGTPKALHAEAGNPSDILGHLIDQAPGECRKKPDPGVCKGHFEAYYFDEDKKSCSVFFWGGCGGVVPFETKEACEKACLNRP